MVIYKLYRFLNHRLAAAVGGGLVSTSAREDWSFLFELAHWYRWVSNSAGEDLNLFSYFFSISITHKLNPFNISDINEYPINIFQLDCGAIF